MSKDLSQRGAKSKAGKLLSQYLRLIAQEFESIDNAGDPYTKAELLARKIWEKALEGDKTMIQLVFDRMEGKPSTVNNKDPRSDFPIADNVSDKGKNTINKFTDNLDKE